MLTTTGMYYVRGAMTVGIFVGGAATSFVTPPAIRSVTHDPRNGPLPLEALRDRETIPFLITKRRRRYRQDHQSAQSVSRHAAWGNTYKASARNHRVSSSMPSTIVGLTDLDMMPRENKPVKPNTSTSRRSRKGKYPVVELWRGEDLISNSRSLEHNADCIQENGTGFRTGESIGADNGQAGASDDDGYQGRRTAGREDTALGHLQAVLGLSEDQTDAMLEIFPALAELHPDRLDLRAKLLFLRHTMLADEATVVVSFPQFFGHPLERHIAPRHAFLVASGQRSGAKLVERDCRGLRRMLELPINRFVTEMVPGRDVSDYRRFEQSFLRGPFDAARRGDAETLRLLRSHGWDCWETDRRGRTALFWAAGGGFVQACEALIEAEGGLRPCSEGEDGSTPLHWAAAGVEVKRFGTGGSANMCRWLLEHGADPTATTEEGNTVIMWAAWAGGFDVTRWAVEEAGANLGLVNKNGCSVAHWAASGGDEAVCRYLHSRGVDFMHENKGGNDPLNHAVAYGRRNIASWLLTLWNQPTNRGAQNGDGGQMSEEGKRSSRRRRDDPVLLDLARLTGDHEMEVFLRTGQA